jgi:hypothetical protein
VCARACVCVCLHVFLLLQVASACVLKNTVKEVPHGASRGVS